MYGIFIYIVLCICFFVDKTKADDSFVEKLTAQIIKNVQLKISNIHIRYEDKVTNVGKPFAWGITLSNLAMQTTDETWNPAIVQEAVTKIYKVFLVINHIIFF